MLFSLINKYCNPQIDDKEITRDWLISERSFVMREFKFKQKGNEYNSLLW